MFKVGDKVKYRNDEETYIVTAVTLLQTGARPTELIKMRDLDGEESEWVGAGFYEHAGELPYLVKQEIVYTKHYNPEYGDEKLCSKCGHTYYHHFDFWEDMKAIGCKYCDCEEFERKE